MLSVLKAWGQRYFSDPQAVVLLAILGVIFGLLLCMSHILMPILVSIVLAYVLQWMSRGLERHGLSRGIAISFVYTGFLSVFLIVLFLVIPLAFQQLSLLFDEVPAMAAQVQDLSRHIPARFLEVISPAEIEHFSQSALGRLHIFGEDLVSASIEHIPTLILILVYLFVVPFLVFFFLKDQQKILQWFGQFLPRERTFLSHIWYEVNGQLGNYIRGKLAEVLIVTVATYVVFYCMHMPYATLLAALVGLSVMVPYVGAVVVTIPVILVACWQWGFSSHCFYTLLLFGVVQAMDAYILVPLLFSEAVNLHPAVIMMAIIVFGGWWGIWGVFFAIPLATLLKAMVSAWPSRTFR